MHKRFLEWEAADVFGNLWKAGLAEYDEMQGIAWRWQSVDGGHVQGPAGARVSRTQSDRSGKKMGASVISWSMAVGSRCPSS